MTEWTSDGCSLGGQDDDGVMTISGPDSVTLYTSMQSLKGQIRVSLSAHTGGFPVSSTPLQAVWTMDSRLNADLCYQNRPYWSPTTRVNDKGLDAC